MDNITMERNEKLRHLLNDAELDSYIRRISEGLLAIDSFGDRDKAISYIIRALELIKGNTF